MTDNDAKKESVAAEAPQDREAKENNGDDGKKPDVEAKEEVKKDDSDTKEEAAQQEESDKKESEAKDGESSDKPKGGEPAAKKQKLDTSVGDPNEAVYTLDAPPSDDNDPSKIPSPSIMLFGLHPLVREGPLRVLLEKSGEVKSVSIRSAFASRYAPVEFKDLDAARAAYKDLNGAKLMQKSILIQPTPEQQKSG